MLFKSLREVSSSGRALPGRDEPVATASRHFVLDTGLHPPYPEAASRALFAMGCFWGAERVFWELAGAYSTMVGYAGGATPNPTYHEVCTGRTGHAEVVRVVFYPDVISYETLLKVFWQSHNPMQGMRQGNDVGTQYRSGVYACDDEQMMQACVTRDRYQVALARAGYGGITTEVTEVPKFYYAEEYHQQYLAKNPGGYCGQGGTGVRFPKAMPGSEGIEEVP